MGSNKFSRQLIQWQQQHGRHALPWQKNPTAYRVWISEIMLQQTQVTAVIPYYRRFMRSFPSIKKCAEASIDEVLAHWSGLGYYARARNLHKTAQIIHQQYSGRLPTTVDALMSLPGIGRSTAGAIISFSTQQHAVILDGNVKRVLARYDQIAGWPGNKSVHDQLWEVAIKLTPHLNSATYNQAMMDLGSLICTRSSPQCQACPVHSQCKAFARSEQHLYPGKKPKQKTRRKQSTLMLILQNKRKEVLLIKRPDRGIWGGLWSFPEAETLSQLKQNWQRQINGDFARAQTLPIIEHSFSHYDLTIKPIVIQVNTMTKTQQANQHWHDLLSDQPGGIPAPVQTLFNLLKENPHD